MNIKKNKPLEEIDYSKAPNNCSLDVFHEWWTKELSKKYKPYAYKTK